MIRLSKWPQQEKCLLAVCRMIVFIIQTCKMNRPRAVAGKAGRFQDTELS